MNEETIKEIFMIVAFRAMEEGRELRLEKGKNTSTCKALNGILTDSNTNYDSLILTVSQPMQELQTELEEEEEDDDTGRTD